MSNTIKNILGFIFIWSLRLLGVAFVFAILIGMSISEPQSTTTTGVDFGILGVIGQMF